jgi:hypothetical protein
LEIKNGYKRTDHKPVLSMELVNPWEVKNGELACLGMPPATCRSLLGLDCQLNASG